MTLDFETYRRLGVELASIRDRVTSLSVLIRNSYPEGSRLDRAAMRMTKGIDAVRSLLDSEVFREFKGLTTNVLASIYYPDPEDRVVWEQWWTDPPVNATWDGKWWIILEGE